MIAQLIFAVVTIGAFVYAFKQFSKIRRNILLGKDETVEGDTSARWKNVLLVAFGQQKMFKRWIPAVFHLFIYVAFLFTQIELIEIMIDGFFGVHRFFANYLGILYSLIIGSVEVLSVLALIATVIFLWRRNVKKIDRFEKEEMKGWPKLDANLILFGELTLIFAIFCMNGADAVLQNMDPAHYPNTGTLPFSGTFGPMILGGLPMDVLIWIERFGWWLHLFVVYSFLLYLPSSKHLHIFLAFPNVYFSKVKSRGEMENMPAIMNEVKSMMGVESDGAEMGDEIPDFGANDVFGLSWKNIMDAYTCTECGRCTSECPANQTGKKLSPRKIMMDIRDRAEEIGNNLDNPSIEFLKKEDRGQKLTKENYDDGKSLFDYISKEELHACTTCNACVEACPVMIDPLEPILKMRRYEILTESAGPSDWLPMFNAIENTGAVWTMPDERDQWTELVDE